MGRLSLVLLFFYTFFERVLTAHKKHLTAGAFFKSVLSTSIVSAVWIQVLQTLQLETIILKFIISKMSTTEDIM